MHALHMIIGIGLLTSLIIGDLRGRFSPSYYTPIELTGLYWHFVDVVWIFLFPLLLPDRTAFMKSEPLISVRVYTIVFLTLIALTLLTTAVAFVDLGGELNSVAAVSIAVRKALLVILYFMHVRYSDRLTWVFAGAGFFWLVILVTLTMSDALTRN
jgi:cytochrome c oxidase subunit IV